MKKNIWLLNHYAAAMYKNRGGRHYWFAENLITRGYNPTIFCASTVHNSKENIDTGGQKYVLSNVNGIPFTFVNSPDYTGNGKKRILNMITFYKNLFPVAKEYAKSNGKPDIILASSVHPLTLVAGIKIAKRFGVPCICEVRDLWPESIVAYGILKRNSVLAKILYQGEKWIYKKADKLIFSIEGGKDYIVDRGWDQNNGGVVDINKVHHINNGIDLEAFDNNIKHYVIKDPQLNNKRTFKVIYAGAIRKANNLELILNAARYVKENSKEDIEFLIYGDGNERERLEQKCINEKICNITFKGKVDRKYIPYILNNSNLNILNYSYHDIWKYGGSQNKKFEYLASGRPVLSTITMGYDIIEKYAAGISLNDQSAKNIGDTIIKIAGLTEKEYSNLCNNARKAAEDYDFRILTDKLINIIETI